MLDWQGEMVQKKHRRQVLLSAVKADDVMAASLSIGQAEVSVIDTNLERSYENSSEVTQPPYPVIPRGCDEISSVLAGVDPCLNDEVLYQRLEARAKLGDFMMAVGSTTVLPTSHLDSDFLSLETVRGDDDSDDEVEAEGVELNDDALMEEILEQATAGDIDFDDIMASATHAKRSQGVDAEHLSKVWRITVQEAQRTLGITTQDKVHTDNPKLARNYGSNDRMLRYNRIKEFFYMDTFFATSKAGKSTRGHTCCQLFVMSKISFMLFP